MILKILGAVDPRVMAIVPGKVLHYKTLFKDTFSNTFIFSCYGSFEC